MFDRITIIGLGLIGSSIARAAQEHRLAKIIVGCDPNEDSLAFAMAEGFIQQAAINPAEAVQNSEMVVLACPPSALGEIARAIAPHLLKGAIVMDVASVKQPAMEAIAPHIPEGVHFIPCHPIAGSQHAGVRAGNADLFEHKLIIITPDIPEMTEPLQQIMYFWKKLGGYIEAMPANVHDLVYAYVSHLPQLLAFAIKPMLAPYKNATSETFQKFTRLGGSSPTLWADILDENKNNVINALDRYLDVINHIKNELKDAPEAPEHLADPTIIYTTIFPRIAAACLITTVMETEKKSGFAFARFAGLGFADFTYPATLPPDADIERISGQHEIVMHILDEYILALQNLHAVISEGNAQNIKLALAT